MSLNGLDATDINEAFQSALAEGGGWYQLPLTPTHPQLITPVQVSAQVCHSRRSNPAQQRQRRSRRYPRLCCPIRRPIASLWLCPLQEEEGHTQIHPGWNFTPAAR